MGVYHDQVLPRMINVACGSKSFTRWREQVTEGLVGHVIEIGFGSGTNVPFYPETVERVSAVEPAKVATSISSKRVSVSDIPVEFIGLDGHAIPLDDESCDSALCTFTLCTVARPDEVLREVRRVLRPGAQLHLLEHGIAPDASTARWQHRIDPLERRLLGGCELTRDIPRLVTDAGFTIDSMTQRYAKGPKPWSWFTCAVASKR